MCSRMIYGGWFGDITCRKDLGKVRNTYIA